MSPVVLGQRFISEAEPELGLGRVERVESRRIELHFPAADTVRQYALESAPIKRVTFRVGDQVESSDGRRFTVEAVDEEEGLFVYRGDGSRVPETELSASLVFSKPEERLLAELWDESKAFDLRYRTLLHGHAVRSSPARGFLGARIELIPHQLYISGEIASRPYPRALLADEVGLGKTIEAGLVLHRLLRSGRMSRVLVLVPESLVHQWFVEMFRRFHLSFTIIDEAHCEAVGASEAGANPFLLTQQAIASLEFLEEDGRRAGQAIEAGWDMLVVDEAHHVEWSPGRVSPAYALLESLASRSPGLLLLTATPEQLGAESHFARLRLLDPDRYSSFESYRREAARYHDVAAVAGKLLDEDALDVEDVETLERVLPAGAASLRHRLHAVARGDAAARGPFISELMDQHGPGRVIFRNSRNVLDRFPERELKAWRLDWPSDRVSQYERLAREFVVDTRDTGLVIDYDYTDDVRAAWLRRFLRDVSPEKVLVICRFQEKAMALHEALRVTSTIPAGLFHEGLSLLQRDRNAAWFAEEDGGAEVLICSEIGSEGRNFQFAHHLVLFDLPASPELLEQRIGRLYRIGQEHTVEIHVPFLPGSAQEMLLLWYHEGLSAFETSVPEGAHFEGLADRLRELALDRLESASPHADTGPPKGFSTLIEETRSFRDTLSKELEAGRDRLLELSSCRPEEAEALISEIKKWDEDESVDDFVGRAFDYLGGELDRIAPRTFVFRQGSQLLVDTLPGLRASEVAMTSDRDRATHQGELDFLTWDHPTVVGIMELLQGGEHGNASVAFLTRPGPEALLLEAVFVLEAIAPPDLFVDRFLSPTPVRVVVDHRGHDVTREYSHEELADKLRDGRKLFRSRDASWRDELFPRMLEEARRRAHEKSPELLDRATAVMEETMTGEIQRLRTLAEVNDHVRSAEIDRLVDESTRLEDVLRSTSLRLDALRVIWRSPRSVGI